MTATTTKTVTITLEGKEVDDLAIACRNTKHLLMRQHDETASRLLFHDIYSDRVKQNTEAKSMPWKESEALRLKQLRQT